MLQYVLLGLADRGGWLKVGGWWPWLLATSIAMNVALVAGIVEYARQKDALGAVQHGGSAFMMVAGIAVVIVLAWRR